MFYKHIRKIEPNPRTIKIYYKFIDDMFEIFELYSHTFAQIKKMEQNIFAIYFRNLLIFDNFVSKKTYCKTPRTKESLTKFLGYDEKHPAYFINSYVIPLIEQGILAYTIPSKPRSKNQKIYTVE